MDENRQVPSTWRRLTARSIDELIVLVLFFPMWGFWYEMMDSEEVVYVPLYLFVFLLLFPAIYEFVFLSLFQQTPGKWLCQLWVVPRHDSHKKLSVFHAFLRALAGRLSLFFGWAPYATAFFRYDRTHVVDWFAETRVVQPMKRTYPAKIRWFVGFLAIWIYSYHGFNEAIYMWDSIDWESGRVDLQEAMGSGSAEEYGIDFPWTDDTDED